VVVVLETVVLDTVVGGPPSLEMSGVRAGDRRAVPVAAPPQAPGLAETGATTPSSRPWRVGTGAPAGVQAVSVVVVAPCPPPPPATRAPAAGEKATLRIERARIETARIGPGRETALAGRREVPAIDLLPE